MSDDDARGAARGLARGGRAERCIAASARRERRLPLRSRSARDAAAAATGACRRCPTGCARCPATAFSDLHGREVRTVKQCPPFVDAMRHGFVMRLPCDVRVADGRFSWDWDLPALSGETQPRSPLSFHAPAQVDGIAVCGRRGPRARQVQQLLDHRA